MSSAADGSEEQIFGLAGLAPRLHAQGSWRFSHFCVGTEPDKDLLAIAPRFGPTGAHGLITLGEGDSSGGPAGGTEDCLLISDDQGGWSDRQRRNA